MDFTKNIGLRIQFRRKELNISQGELARQANISSSHLSAIENGRQTPSIDLFYLLCKSLKTSPDFFLLGNNPNKSLAENIIDATSLCNPADQQLIEQIIDYYFNMKK